VSLTNAILLLFDAPANACGWLLNRTTVYLQVNLQCRINMSR
jgi:hypothetical protein